MVEDEFLDEYVMDARDQLSVLNEGLLELENNPRDKNVINRIFRAAHTLKGNSAAMGYMDISSLAHKIENVLDKVRLEKLEITDVIVDALFGVLDALESMIEAISSRVPPKDCSQILVKLDSIISDVKEEPKKIVGKKEAKEAEIGSEIKKVSAAGKYELEGEVKSEEACKPEATPIKEVQTIRVGTDKLDALVNLVGELIINKSRFSQIASEADQEPLNNALTALERLLRDLQDLGMSMRLVKVAHVFDRFPRMVRDLAKEMGKDVEFTVEGKEIELDRTVLDRLGDPLVHLLRNCIDHGIEPPEEREKNGKPKKGVVKLSARRIKDHVEIAVEDDGRGINPEELKKAAVRKGFLSSKEAEKLNEEEAIDLIFKPGFSGAKKVTDVSGRGVGMDVVKNMVTKLGGSIQVSSTKGKGSVLSLKLPLSLAIIKVLLVEVKDDVYAIPTKNVVEVLSCKNFKIKTVKGKEAIVHRREPLPVLRLGKILNSYNGEPTKDSKFIVVEKFNKKIGLAVERVLRQEEVVIKSLGEGLTNIAGISGATILGNGKVALILDVYNLV